LPAGFVPLAAVAAACWWLTAPLEDPATSAPRTAALPPARVPAPGAATRAEPKTLDFPDWPQERSEAAANKQLLLDTLLIVQDKLEKVAGYTTIFHKQERINGVLGVEQVMDMKIRHHPFAVYLKYRAPHAGKEVVYAEGPHANKIIAHSTGVARFLVPRLAVPPNHPLAMAETRHSITEAGLANLTAKLIDFRQMDLDDAGAVTVLDRTRDANGRPWLRSIHIHPQFDARRPFARVEVLYDPETRLPLQIQNFDWPRPGQDGELLLAERYAYEDLDLEAGLTALDFDPANPEYAFHRY
jgi:hypothetical protein